MKAIRVHELGEAEVLRYEEAPVPSPKGDEALVEVKAIGLNYIDTYHRKGLYKVDLPFTPGLEAAGVVTAIGADVKSIRPGDRVAYAMNLGAYAEQAVVPAWKLVSIPSELSFEQAAAAMLQGMTAHYLSHSTYPLKKGDTALVHAAAGGVGLLLVQMAKLRGARVLGTVSTPEKAALARQAGADEVILYSQSDFESEVRRLTEGAGVEVVYESVGKATFDKSLNCLKNRGYLVLYGQSSGPVPALDPQILNNKGSLFLTRPSLGHYAANREELKQRADDVLGWAAQKKLDLRIGRHFPLAEAAEAHRALEGRKTTGKVLLIP